MDGGTSEPDTTSGGMPEWAEILGVGAAGQLRILPSIVTNVALRKKTRRLRQMAKEEEARQRQVAMQDLALQEKDTAHQYGHEEEGRASDVAERTGYSSSSYNEYSKNQLTEDTQRRMDAIQRARANLQAGWSAEDTMRRLQESIADVQRRAAIAEAILNEGMGAISLIGA